MWAAGLFEGEGYFGFANTHSLRSAKATIAMTDLDVVLRFDSLFPGRLNMDAHPRFGKQGQVWKRSFRWTRAGLAAEEFGMVMLPHMGERRTKQIMAALAIVDKDHVAVCVWCADTFRSYRGTTTCSAPCRKEHRNQTERLARLSRLSRSRSMTSASPASEATW